MPSKLKLICYLSIPLGIGLFFDDNIRGHYRFKAICSARGGLHASQSLERNVGWVVRGGRVSEVRYPLSFEAIKFVRYRNETDGRIYDVYRQERRKVSDDGYVEMPADLNEPVVYEYRVSVADVPNETRLRSLSSEVIDLRTSAVVASYVSFTFSQFEPSRTLLAAPSDVQCPEDAQDPRTGKLTSLKEQAFASLFKQ